MNPPSALVIGESLIDVVAREGHGATEHVGGSPANVALGLARFGFTVRFATALGSDPRGARIAAYLEESGVKIDSASWNLERTSTATAVIRDGGSAEYAFEIEWPRVQNVDIAGIDLVHAGSLAIFLDPGAQSTADVLRRAREAEVIVSLDPNIRSALLPDHTCAVQLFEDVARLSHLVKLSDEDAEWLYQTWPESVVIQHLLSLGADLVAITRGAAGFTLSTRDHRVRGAARAVVVTDTVGAGDAFQAALLSWILDHPNRVLNQLGGADLGEMGDLAARAAAWTVEQSGAQPPTRRQIDPVRLTDR